MRYIKYIIGKKYIEGTKMHKYPSDISREEFEIVREDLETAKKRTKPRQTDLYDIFCAILYVVKGGIQWRMLPSDFPKWQLCYYYFRIWSWKGENNSKESVLEKALKKIGKNGTQ